MSDHDRRLVPARADDPILIVGGGASGVLSAAHLLRRAGERVVLVERSEELGAGAAYATNHPDHLLNVRAANMSAFPDDPAHFSRWLATRTEPGRLVPPDGFAPRQLYRDYLSSLLAPHLASGRLGRVRGEAVSVDRVDDGMLVRLADGRLLRGRALIVATGNEGPSLPPAPWRHDGWGTSGWGASALDGIDPGQAVVIVGTGLTMVDRVLALLQAGHRGPITAVSRRGLLPQAHRAVPAVALPEGDVPLGTGLGRLTRWLRSRVDEAERRGGDWRQVIDALRPHTQALWQSFPASRRRRFLRHARPFWDQHRHRIAPQAAERIGAALADGTLRVLAGHVTRFEPVGDHVVVHVRHRSSPAETPIRAGAVFECRGRAADVTHTANPLLRQMLASGLARPDALRLGLDVTPSCALVDAAGRASGHAYAVGPVTSGVFWEVTAVPDIRVQAAGLAARVAARHHHEDGLTAWTAWRV